MELTPHRPAAAPAGAARAAETYASAAREPEARSRTWLEFAVLALAVVLACITWYLSRLAVNAKSVELALAGERDARMSQVAALKSQLSGAPQPSVAAGANAALEATDASALRADLERLRADLGAQQAAHKQAEDLNQLLSDGLARLRKDLDQVRTAQPVGSASSTQLDAAAKAAEAAHDAAQRIEASVGISMREWKSATQSLRTDVDELAQRVKSFQANVTYLERSQDDLRAGVNEQRKALEQWGKRVDDQAVELQRMTPPPPPLELGALSASVEQAQESAKGVEQILARQGAEVSARMLELERRVQDLTTEQGNVATRVQAAENSLGSKSTGDPALAARLESLVSQVDELRAAQQQLAQTAGSKSTGDPALAARLESLAGQVDELRAAQQQWAQTAAATAAQTAAAPAGAPSAALERVEAELLALTKRLEQQERAASDRTAAAASSTDLERDVTGLHAQIESLRGEWSAARDALGRAERALEEQRAAQRAAEQERKNGLAQIERLDAALAALQRDHALASQRDAATREQIDRAQSELARLRAEAASWQRQSATAGPAPDRSLPDRNLPDQPVAQDAGSKPRAAVASDPERTETNAARSQPASATPPFAALDQLNADAARNEVERVARAHVERCTEGGRLLESRLREAHELDDLADALSQHPTLSAPGAAGWDLRLLADARRWYLSEGALPGTALDFSDANAGALVPAQPHYDWRAQLELQRRLGAIDSTWPARANERRFFRAEHAESGHVVWFAESIVASANADGAKSWVLQRTPYVEGERDFGRPQNIQVARRDATLSIANHVVANLRDSSENVMVAAWSGPQAHAAPERAGLPSPTDLEAFRAALAQQPEACLVVRDGDALRWLSPRFGLVREEVPGIVRELVLQSP